MHHVTQALIICLISVALFTTNSQAKKPTCGYLILNNGSHVAGFINYRRIDVATRVVFYQKDSITQKIIESTKTLFGPREIRGFVYNDKEKWLSVTFTKKELGFDASYFMQVRQETQNFNLLGGMVTAEGCNCSGTKITASYHWILQHKQEGNKIILAQKKWQKVNKPEWVAAFFAQYGYDFESNLFVKPDDVLAPLGY